MNIGSWLESVSRDLRYGTRELARNKGFTATALLSVALGQEFGVRMAVGANFADIVRLVLARGLRLICGGLAVGFATTLLLLKNFGIQLGVTDPFDPMALASACVVLLATGIVACLVPAFRAGRTDPLQALR